MEKKIKTLVSYEELRSTTHAPHVVFSLLDESGELPGPGDVAPLADVDKVGRGVDPHGFETRQEHLAVVETPLRRPSTKERVLLSIVKKV